LVNWADNNIYAPLYESVISKYPEAYSREDGTLPEQKSSKNYQLKPTFSSAVGKPLVYSLISAWRVNG